MSSLSTSRFSFFFFKDKTFLLKSGWCIITELYTATDEKRSQWCRDGWKARDRRPGKSFIPLRRVGAVLYAEVQPQKTAVCNGLFCFFVDGYFVGAQKLFWQRMTVQMTHDLTLRTAVIEACYMCKHLAIWFLPTLTLSVGSGTYPLTSSGSCLMDSGLGLVACTLM